MWSVHDILKKSPTNTLPTPPPSPIEHPSRFGRSQSWVPGVTPVRRPHPYSRYTSIPLPHPVCTQPLELEFPDVLTPPSLPSTPRQPLQELPGSTPCQRFGKPSHRDDLNELCKPYIPATTKSNNSWATGVFKSWVKERNANANTTGERFPADLLETRYPTAIVDRTLSAFVIEARRVDGNFYPGNTLKNILSALFRVMKEQQGAVNVVSFMEKASREKVYPQLNNAFDRQLRMLRSSGIGIERKRAQVITPDIRQQMWRMGVLGYHSPEALLNAVFFYNGQNFCLRGVQEHYNLRFTQIQYATNPESYIYNEFGSKKHPGGINDTSSGKTVPIVATGSHHCHVKILNLYLSKVPQNIRDCGGPFYLSPLPFTPTRKRPWFYEEPLSLTKLKGLLKKMCKDAKVEGNFTNHSLRATGATLLFDAGVPELVVQKRTGHKSLDALRAYERITPRQEMQVAQILSDPPVASYTPPQEYTEDFSVTPEEDSFLENIPMHAYDEF